MTRPQFRIKTFQQVCGMMGIRQDQNDAVTYVIRRYGGKVQQDHGRAHVKSGKLTSEKLRRTPSPLLDSI